MNIITSVDNSIYSFIAKFMCKNVTQVMLVLSHLASAVTFITLVIAFFILLEDKKEAKYISLNLIVGFSLNRILKFIIKRPRPNVLKLVNETSYSFPSGHTMTATFMYGFFIYLICKKVKNKSIRYISIILHSLLIFFIGISRIYLGVHYATDVLGGWIIGIIYLVLFIKYVCNKNINKERERV